MSQKHAHQVLAYILYFVNEKYCISFKLFKIWSSVLLSLKLRLRKLGQHSRGHFKIYYYRGRSLEHITRIIRSIIYKASLSYWIISKLQRQNTYIMLEKKLVFSARNFSISLLQLFLNNSFFISDLSLKSQSELNRV